MQKAVIKLIKTALLKNYLEKNIKQFEAEADLLLSHLKEFLINKEFDLLQEYKNNLIRLESKTIFLIPKREKNVSTKK